METNQAPSSSARRMRALLASRAMCPADCEPGCHVSTALTQKHASDTFSSGASRPLTVQSTSFRVRTGLKAWLGYCQHDLGLSFPAGQEYDTARPWS